MCARRLWSALVLARGARWVGWESLGLGPARPTHVSQAEAEPTVVPSIHNHRPSLLAWDERAEESPSLPPFEALIFPDCF